VWETIRSFSHYFFQNCIRLFVTHKLTNETNINIPKTTKPS